MGFTGAVPLSFLIDKEGRLIFKHEGGFSDILMNSGTIDEKLISL